MFRAELLDRVEIARFGEVEARIGRNRLEDDAGDLGSLFLKKGFEGLQIVEGDGGGEGSKSRRNAGAVGLAEGESAASRFDQ